MPNTANMYGKVKTRIWGKQIDWLNDTIKVMLVDSTYVPNQDSHELKSHITGEVTGTGYTAGGFTLATKTVTYDAVNNRTVLDAADILVTNTTISDVKYLVIYDDTHIDKPLIAYFTLDPILSSNDGKFEINWDATGIIHDDVV